MILKIFSYANPINLDCFLGNEIAQDRLLLRLACCSMLHFESKRGFLKCFPFRILGIFSKD